MLRYRAMVTASLVLCLLVVLSLGVSADLPPEMPGLPSTQSLSLQDYLASSSGSEGKSLQQAPVGAETPLGIQDLLASLSSSPVKALKRAPVMAEPSEDRESGAVRVLGQQTLPSIADACILQGRATQNFGIATDMWVGYDEYQAPYPKTARSFVRFDIAALPPTIAINSATLRLYLVNSWDFPNKVRTVTTYRVPSAWSETSLTWNNAPQPAEAYGQDSVRHLSWGWYEFDVTDLVRAWGAGTYPEHGIMVRAPEVSGYDSSRRGFSTREGPFTPQLVVQYTVLTPWCWCPLIVAP